MSLEMHSKNNKNNLLGAFLAAGLAVIMGASPTSATPDWQAVIQPGSAVQALGVAPVADAPRAGRKVASAFIGARQSPWTVFTSKMRQTGRDLNQASRRGVSMAFAGGRQESRLDVLRSVPAASAGAAGPACAGTLVPLTGQVATVSEGRCEGVSD